MSARKDRPARGSQGNVVSAFSPAASVEFPPPTRALKLWLPILLSACWVFAVFWLLRGGTKHPELDTYLPYHLSKAPLFEKVYDSRVLDGDAYQSRELSYVVDHLDTLAIQFGAENGYPHFISVSYLAFTFLLVLWLWLFFRRDLALGVFPSTVLITLFLSAPCVLLSGSYFRSSKIGVALITGLFAISVFRYTNRKERPAWLSFAVCTWLFLLGFLCGRFDRQGVFLLCLALFYVLMRAFALRSLRSLVLCLPIGLALAADAVYNRIVAPHLTWALNGYWPNFSFQTMPWNEFFGHVGQHFSRAFGLSLDTLRFLGGDLCQAHILILFLGVCWLFWINDRPTADSRPSFVVWSRSLAAPLLGVGLLALVTLLNALMVCRHEPLIWADIRRVYYWLPATVIWTIGTAVTLRLLYRIEWLPRKVLVAGLCLLAIGNLASVSDHVDVIRHGHLGGDLSKNMLAALRDPHAKSIQPDVANHLIYQLLKSGANRFNNPRQALFRVESEHWIAEVLSADTNRTIFAFVPVDAAGSTSRGAIIQAPPSVWSRSCLFGDLKKSGPDGVTYGFTPKHIQPPSGSLYTIQVRVKNKTTTDLPFRVGSLQMFSPSGLPLTLFAAGVDKWPFSKEAEADREGALAKTLPIAAGHEQVVVLAYTGTESLTSFTLKVVE